MPHRHLAVVLVVVLSLWTVNRARAKRLVRSALNAVNRLLLRCTSRSYRPADGLTVVFAPHQDDETLGCGGLIAHKRYAGWPVHVFFLTDGGGSHPDHPEFTNADVIALRQREARAALSELGVESSADHFFDEPDGTLARIPRARARALIDRIAAQLSALNPAEVFLPCCPDGSSEHDAAYAISTAAMRQAGLHPAVWQYPIWSWWNPTLLLQHLITAKIRCRLPNADFAAAKRSAVACYVSQVRPTPPWPEAVIPSDLLAALQSDAEYFFHHETPPPHESAPEI